MYLIRGNSTPSSVMISQKNHQRSIGPSTALGVLMKAAEWFGRSVVGFLSDSEVRMERFGWRLTEPFDSLNFRDSVKIHVHFLEFNRNSEN